MPLVTLQMGHHGRTSGSTGAPGEQAYAAGVAERAKPLLEQLGCQVRLISADEPDGAYRGDLFVAVHYDGGAPGASGPSVGFQSPQGRRLAELWKDAYRRRCGNRVGPFRGDNYTIDLARYYGVRKAVAQGNRAAVIVEGGFGTHPLEGPWLRSQDGMSAGAEAIRDAVAAYLGRRVPTLAAGDDMNDSDRQLLHEVNTNVKTLLTRLGIRDGSVTVLTDLGRLRRDFRRLVCDLDLSPDTRRPEGGYES